MKKHLVFHTLIALLLLLPIHSAAAVVPSTLTDVTLFSGQALVTRTAVVSVQKGLNEILVEAAAFNIDSDSVTAKVFGEGELYSVQLKDIFLPEAPQANIKTLEKKIETRTYELKTVNDKKNMLQSKALFLKSVVDFSQTQVPKDIKTAFPKIENLNKTLAFLEENFNAIHTQQRKLEQEADTLTAEIEALKKELNTLTRNASRKKNIVEILFNAEKSQQIRLETRYLAYNAGWHPLYKATVPQDLSAVNLVMFSKIQQKTGEDWNNVTLSISNVVPLRGADLPDVNPWILNITRPRPMAEAKRHALYAQKSAAPMDAVMAEAPPPAPAEVEAAFVSAETAETALSFEYRMPRKLSIESSEKTTILPLFSKTLTGDFEYHAAPAFSPFAFLVCKTAADTELMSGPMNVHLGPQFVGKTFLNARKAGTPFVVNLGADRGVKIKREKISDKVDETFFGSFEKSTVARKMAYKINVENLKNTPVVLNILDRIPVSGTDKIKVEDIQLTPAPDKKNYQDREGVLMWRIPLKPGEQKSIDIVFVIQYPRDAPVIGL